MVCALPTELYTQEFRHWVEPDSIDLVFWVITLASDFLIDYWESQDLIGAPLSASNILQPTEGCSCASLSTVPVASFYSGHVARDRQIHVLL